MTSVIPLPSDAKYMLLAQDLRDQIESGRLKPGDQLPSFVALRSRHGVSRGTVEKVYSVLERDGLIVREQGRGVFVTPPKPRVATGVIAFTGGGVAEIKNSRFWAHLMSGLQEAALANRTQLLLVNEHVDATVLDGVDGLLLSENEDATYPILERVPAGLPCVSILTPVEDVSCVLADDVRGAREATTHLLELGHRRIGYLVSGYSHLVENHLLGYRQALGAYGIEPPLAWVRQLRPRARSVDSKAEYIKQGRRTMREWLRSDWAQTRCTAILTLNDPAAVGVIQELQHTGLRVPEDVSVVGYDGVEAFDYFTPRLTTVEVPVDEIGRTAVETLLARIHDRATDSESVIVPTQLRVGESTAPPPESQSEARAFNGNHR